MCLVNAIAHFQVMILKISSLITNSEKILKSNFKISLTEVQKKSPSPKNNFYRKAFVIRPTRVLINLNKTEIDGKSLLYLVGAFSGAADPKNKIKAEK